MCIVYKGRRHFSLRWLRIIQNKKSFTVQLTAEPKKRMTKDEKDVEGREESRASE